MKKIIYAALLVASTLGISSCKDDPNLPTPATVDYPIVRSTLTEQSVYSLASVGNNSQNPSVSFTVEVAGPVERVESIEVYRSARVFTTPTGTTLAVQPRVLLRSIPPTTATIDVTINEAIAGLTRPGTPRTPLTRASLRAGEGFLFTYELLLKDGQRVVFTPLSSAGVVSGAQANAPFSGLVLVQ